MLTCALLAPLLLLPATARAYTLNVSGVGYSQTVGGALQNVATTLALSIGAVCIAIFTIGALFYTGSLGNEERKSLGKGMMIGSLVAVGIVVGARGILAMVTYFFFQL